MQLQWSKQCRLNALFAAILSTTVGFSCSQMQAQSSTSQSPTMTQTSSTQSQITREDTFVTRPVSGSSRTGARSLSSNGMIACRLFIV